MLYSFYSFSQSNAKLDSLKKVLAKLPKEGASFAGDTTRVRVLCEMGEISDLNKGSIEYIDSAVTITKKLNWKKGIAESVNLRGWIYLRNGFYFQSIEDLNEGLLLSTKLKDNFIRAYSYRFLGACYFEMEEDKKAIENYKSALQIYNHSNEPSSIRAGLLTLNNIGLCYARLKDFETAIRYYKQAIPKGSFLKDSSALSWLHSNLGSSLRDGGYLNDAIINYDKSISYLRNRPNINKAFTMSEKAKALLYLHKDKEALALAIQAVELGENTTIFENLYILESLYLSYKTNGKLKEALDIFEKLNKLKFRNEAEIRSKSIEGLKYSFENKKNLIEIKEQNLRSNWLIVGLSVLIVFLFIIFRNNFILNKKNIEINNQKREIELVKDELLNLNQNLEIKVKKRTIDLENAFNEIKEAMMKGQTIERQRVAMELHDNLGSMISGMKFRIQAINRENMNDKEKSIFDGVVTTMSDAYNNIRLLSHNLLPIELENEGFYGALKKLVYDINLSNKIEIKTAFNTEKRILDKKVEFELYGICLELLNNTLRHSQATMAEIATNEKESNFELVIKDNGKGLGFNNLNNGNGMKNINNRLKILNGTISYQENHPKGLSIFILIQNIV